MILSKNWIKSNGSPVAVDITWSTGECCLYSHSWFEAVGNGTISYGPQDRRNEPE